jgi:hypothetical protein
MESEAEQERSEREQTQGSDEGKGNELSHGVGFTSLSGTSGGSRWWCMPISSVKHALAATVVAALAVFTLSALGHEAAAATTHHRHRTPADPALQVPTGLALAPDGGLYIADQWLHEIVERLPTGRFRVVAGTGTSGFSGDGGPATRAELAAPTALVRSPDGTLYFVDQGNQRVRAIRPDGTIETVAGGGPLGDDSIASGTRATEVSFDPADLALGPGGTLYVSDYDQILELLPSGAFAVVDGPTTLIGPDGVMACGPDALAFDRAGLLWVGCDDSRQLLERTTNGTFVVRANAYRPHDFPGLAAAADGSMVAVDGESLSRFTGSHETTLLDLGDFPRRDTFVPGGVAVASDGAIFTDSRYGDGFTTGAALAEIKPDGRIVVLNSWKGRYP